MNCWIGSGRIAREIRVSDSGKVANATFACDAPYPFNKDRDGNKIADFLTLRFIGEANASRAVKYLTKGTKLVVRGVVKRESWQKDGEWNENNYIIVQEWEFAESKAASKSGGGSSDADAPVVKSDDSFMNIPEDDDDGIPFK